MFTVARKFFDLPQNIKEKYSFPVPPNAPAYGYIQLQKERLVTYVISLIHHILYIDHPVAAKYQTKFKPTAVIFWSSADVPCGIDSIRLVRN